MKNTLTRAMFLLALSVAPLRAGTIESDLLIVGGTESGWAAAIEAARAGVKSVTLVHDGNWLGGQYTEQGLACVDENKGVGKAGWGPDWHPMKRSFHRFGLFKELMDRIEALNTLKYGSPMPGRPMHGPSTFRPAEAASVFREMLEPWLETGRVSLHLSMAPGEALLNPDKTRLEGLVFRGLDDSARELTVRARITIDASDWGDVVRLSGAAFEFGPDSRSRYGEPSAPTDAAAYPPNEMNPITWCLIVEESGEDSAISAPPHYDERRYLRATSFGQKSSSELPWEKKFRGGGPPPWPGKGSEAKRQASILTMRRIVDGTTSRDGRTSALICYANAQDYPLERLPRHVAEALERTEPGASKKNLVLMTRAQREIVFADARAHSLGMLRHLQTYVHDRAPDKTNSLRRYRLSPEFGTADSLPPKPYLREGLRLRALYMMREQDALNTDEGGREKAREAFARILYPDGLFSWQFHYDFHDTARIYLKDEEGSTAWTHAEKPGRGVHNLSDRSVFPLRSFLPESIDGLIGAQGNVGFSSIVSSAIRLHDQRVHLGQAAAALAVVSLKREQAPRSLAFDRHALEEIRGILCGGNGGVPMLLFPYRDLPADHPACIAINRLAARGWIPVSRREVDFQPDAPAAPEWRAKVLELAGVEAPEPGDAKEMTRGEFAAHVWEIVKDLPLDPWPRNSPDDADGDGVTDTEDPLPFTSKAQSWPDSSDSTAP